MYLIGRRLRTAGRPLCHMQHATASHMTIPLCHPNLQHAVANNTLQRFNSAHRERHRQYPAMLQGLHSAILQLPVVGVSGGMGACPTRTSHDASHPCSAFRFIPACVAAGSSNISVDMFRRYLYRPRCASLSSSLHLPAWPLPIAAKIKAPHPRAACTSSLAWHCWNLNLRPESRSWTL